VISRRVWGRRAACNLWRLSQRAEKLMYGPERNGDAEIPGLILIAYEDAYRAVLFVPPDWRAGAGANP
jgi:hypothetical protein